MTEAQGRLLLAAYELFSLHGFAGLSLRVLSRQTGTNNAAVVYHFGSKQGLYVAALLRAVDVLEEHAERVTDAIEGARWVDLPPAIEQALRLLAREALDRRVPAKLEPRVAWKLGPDALRRLSRLTAEFSTATLAAAVAHRAIAEPLEQLLASWSLLASDSAPSAAPDREPRTHH